MSSNDGGGKRIDLVLDRKASIIRLGDLATKINREVFPDFSIILLRYACLFIPRWSASSMMINLEIGILPSSKSISSPAGGGSDEFVSHNDLSKASRLVLFAKDDDDDVPPLRKSSNFPIAPDEPAKSLACRT